MRTRGPHPDAATLANWLDGELRPDRDDAVAAHVATCPSCQAEAEGWRAVEAAAAEPLPALPPGFVTRTCARAVEQAPLQAPLWWLGVSPAWRVGLATLLLASAVAGWRLGGTMTPPPDPTTALADALAVPELAALEQASLRGERRQP